MSIYLVILIVCAVLIMMTCMTRGFQKGFIHELGGLISLVCAVLSVVLIAGIADGIRGENAGGYILGGFMLVVMGLVYKMIRLILNPLEAVVELPVISWIDSALGLVIGFIEGFILLYFLEFFLRTVVLA